FYDEYENLMIYVNDVEARTGQWKGVFVADSRTDERQDSAPLSPVPTPVTAPGQTGGASSGLVGQRTSQKIIVAQSGDLAIMRNSKQVWLNLHNAETHVWDPRKPERYDLNRNAFQRMRLPDKFSTDPTGYVRSLREMNLRELIDQARIAKKGNRETSNLANVEIHKKFAIPFACLVFGVVGLPLGITNRRGGKSSGFSLSIAIILFYYVMINNGEHLAALGKIPPLVGMWAPNLILAALGVYLLI